MSEAIKDYRLGLDEVLRNFKVLHRVNKIMLENDYIKTYASVISIDNTLLMFGVNRDNKVELLVEGVKNHYFSARDWLLKRGILKTKEDDMFICGWDEGTEYGVEDESILSNVQDVTMWLGKRAGDKGYTVRWFGRNASYSWNNPDNKPSKPKNSTWVTSVLKSVLF